MKNFDAIIIGSGQAGTPLAFALAEQGKKVAFIEKNTVGGTCVNVGCTPTKAYVASARAIWAAHHAAELGILVPKGFTADLQKIKARKDDLVKTSVEGIRKGIAKQKNITFFKGEAHFTAEKTITIGNQEITAQQIFINVGARPFVPEGFEDVPYLTNESILELTEIPKHLLIVGGSYIGLEFAQMFRRFGSEVTVLEQKSTIISREDSETSEEILRFLKDEGINFALNAECISGQKNERGQIELQANCDKKNQKKIVGSHVLLAVGRKPNTNTLRLENTKIKTDKRDYIKVNNKLETNVKGIFALGDCNGQGAFTHTAYNDFQIIADQLFGEKKKKLSDRILTYALYVDPPLGRAGLTKKEALKKGLKILEARIDMVDVARAREKGETNGFMQIIVDAKTERILGASLLGTGADEIISGILNVMYAKKSYKTIKNGVHVHPTVAELIPTMLEKLRKVSN